MRPSRLNSASPAVSLSMLCLIVVMACSVLALCLPTSTTTNSQKSELNSGLAKESMPALPALFDFENYQRVFKKHYGSNLEKVTRQVYFLEKAFAAYASGVAYKNWQKSYYLTVNEFSDRSPQELAKMQNNLAAEDTAMQTLSNEATTYELNDHVNARPDPYKSVKEFESKIKEALEKANFKSWLEEENVALGRRSDVSSTVGTNRMRPPRPLSIDQLIKGVKRQAEPAQVSQAKMNKDLRSNNPHYDPLALEGLTRGLIDEQENIRSWFLKSPPESWLIDASSESSIIDETSINVACQLPDEMFVDLRTTGCLFPPRNQGSCSACYAFAAMAMMEFLFCTKTGQLVAFSEQYMVDCAKGRVAGAYGCNGGSGVSVTQFVHNFGLELLDNYKYSGRDNECPYTNDTDLKTTGFYRMDLGNFIQIPIEFWAMYLKKGPLFVTIATGKNFRQYGGGIHDGHDCSERPVHAMVVVGHGRESGQEYWLMRNSYGTKWGEDGYYKLAKSAPERCIYGQAGLAFGTKDGVNFVDPRPNDLNTNTKRWLAQLREQQQKQ